MTATMICEVKRIGRMISNTEVNEGKNVYVLIKNGTSHYLITSDLKTVRTFIQCHNYSLYAIYCNNEKVEYDYFIPVWEQF